jgi:hypothetical protein
MCRNLAALSDAEKKTQRDDMESSFFAETLKYLYVLPGPPNTINLKTTVLNTEAHPLRAAPGSRQTDGNYLRQVGPALV